MTFSLPRRPGGRNELLLVCSINPADRMKLFWLAPSARRTSWTTSSLIHQLGGWDETILVCSVSPADEVKLFWFTPSDRRTKWSTLDVAHLPIVALFFAASPTDCLLIFTVLLMCFQLLHDPVVVTRCAADKVGAKGTPTNPFINALWKQLFICKGFSQG